MPSPCTPSAGMGMPTLFAERRPDKQVDGGSCHEHIRAVHSRSPVEVIWKVLARGT